MTRDVRRAGAWFVWACLAAIVAVAGTVHAAEAAHEFVGAQKCSMCHRTEKQGRQYPIWQSSKHAQAYEALGSDEAKTVAAEMGIGDPQQSGACLRCHATAYNFSETRVSHHVAVEEGVSCESCHGPGKDFMQFSVMKDPAAAVAAGLIIPDESTCVRCHNDESPTAQPFHFAESWDQIKHSIPR